MSEAPAYPTGQPSVKQTETTRTETYETQFESDSLSAVLEAIDSFVENALEDTEEHNFPDVKIEVYHTNETLEWKGSVTIIE